MKISVFTDLRFVAYSKPTGVGKHIFQMANGLSRIDGNSVTALASKDQTGDHRFGSLSFLPAREFPLPWKMAEAVWTMTGQPYADRWCGNTDWIYCPKNDFIPIRDSRVAVTVHGAHELDPEMPQARTVSAKLNRLRRRTSYKRLFRQAALVLTVSEFLKEQVVQWFQVDPGKICVVGNGVEPEFFQAAYHAPGASGEPADRPFILCVGGLNYVDGGDRIIELAEHLRTEAPDLRVLVAGHQHEVELQKAAADLPNVKLLGYVPAERLALYMRDALALYFPTRYETFGIAAAEAMAAGTPVITCRSTAVPEIVGDAGIYVGPDQPEAAVEVIESLISSPRLRAELVSRGQKRAHNYTWAACVARLQRALENH